MLYVYFYFHLWKGIFHSFIDWFTHWFIQPTGSAMTHLLHFLHRNSTKNQICCSQTPLCYLQMEDFSSNSLIPRFLVHYPPCSSKYLLIFEWFISWIMHESTLLKPQQSLIHCQALPGRHSLLDQWIYLNIWQRNQCLMNTNVYGSARKIGVKSSIWLCFFTTIFYHKRPKHINVTKHKGNFFTHPVSW